MKRAVLLATVAACLAAVGAIGSDSSKAPPDPKRGLVGTWEHARIREGRQLKHITPTHFIWVYYDPEKMVPLGTAGGTWSIEGDTYKERVDYASDGWEHLRGKEIRLTFKLDGDRWSVKGKLDNGFVIDETWERRKPDSNRGLEK